MIYRSRSIQVLWITEFINKSSDYYAALDRTSSNKDAVNINFVQVQHRNKKPPEFLLVASRSRGSGVCVGLESILGEWRQN